MFAFFKKLFGKADVNKDGRVDVQDAKVAVKAVAAKAKTTARKATVVAKTARAKKSK